MNTLSIIVPAYNMQHLLPRCLDSVTALTADDLEVIVVNDGSTDSTLDVAQDYQRRFPHIVSVIDKPNAQYGSCINAALPRVNGKYVKVLDADDWFDTNALDYLLAKLRLTSNDMVISNYSMINPARKRRYIQYCSHDAFDLHEDPHQPISFFARPLQMHAVAFRSQLLRDFNYHQLERLYYTDQEWAFYPLFFVESWAFVNADVYQYTIGRPEQSTHPDILTRNLSHNQTVCLQLAKFYFEFPPHTLSPQRNALLFNKVLQLVTSIYRTHLLATPNKLFDSFLLSDFDEELCRINEPFYARFDLHTIRPWLPIHYIHLWRARAWRPPDALRLLLRATAALANSARALTTPASKEDGPPPTL